MPLRTTKKSKKRRRRRISSVTLSTNKTAQRTNPALWERVKRSVRAGKKGGPAGRWSARKAQLAVLEYKRRGGHYRGRKSRRNSLVKWTREKWDYITQSSKRSRSTRPSKSRQSKSKKGRYLPETVRTCLSPAEKRRENRSKNLSVLRRKWKAKYSPSVLKKLHQAGIF